MGKIRTWLSSGSKLLGPIFVTLLILYWLFSGVELFFHWLLLGFLDESLYFPGMGWIAALVLIIAVGAITQISYFQKIADSLQEQILKLPGIHQVHGFSSNLVQFFSKKGMKGGAVVKVTTPIGNCLGIITQEDFAKLPEGLAEESEVAVYIPMSYQVGGYTLIVPKDSITPIEASVQKGMALTMSAYMSN